MIKKSIRCLLTLGIFVLSTNWASAQPGLQSNHFKEVILPFVFVPLQEDIKKDSNVQSKTPRLSSLIIQKPSAHPTAFFCKLEEDLIQKWSIPVKFRLGTQDYVDYLEQKNKGEYAHYPSN